MNFRAIGIGIWVHGLGYVAAVLTAVAVSVGLMVLPQLAVGGSGTLTEGFVDDVGRLAMFGLVATTTMALPGFLFALWLARKGGWRRWTAYAIAGFANAFVALVLFQLYLGGFLPVPDLLLPCFPAGYAGGVAYWLVSLKWLGAWPPPAPPTSPAPSGS